MTKLLRFSALTGAIGMMLAASAAIAAEPEWRTAYTLFGEPKYASNFKHFDYVNPKAPKGGLIRFSWPQSFDSLNNFILKGVKGPGLGMLYESMMTGSLDEAQTYYPLLATRYRLADDKTWMEFELNPAAKWHDGQPITAEDVAFSLEVLKTKSDPVYRMVYAPLKEVEVQGKSRVKFHFVDGNNREQALLAATLPILPKHYYATREFEKTTLEPPLGSGPYKICGVEAARAVRYCRVEDYWARALPVNVGQHNFATIRYDVYRDETVALESFKAGNVDLREEYVARNWANAYETPALAAGKYRKELIPNKIPQGMQAFTFNLRKAKFADRRVREAIALSMDFEWLNKSLFYNAYSRNRSFFLNTPFEARDVPNAAEAKLLEPYRAQLPEALWYEPFEPSHTDGDGNNRPNLLRAQALLNEAGWKLKDGVRISPVDGKPLEIEFLLAQPTLERVVGRMRAGLQKLGIQSRVRTVDSAQYQHRVDHRDFDVISIWINRGLNFPGVEQTSFWHSAQADVEGSNNVAGMKSPLVDELTTRIANAQTLEELTPAARALDRVLLWDHVVIPHWHVGGWRLAWWDKFGQPTIRPEYGLNTSAWWMKE
jgi:microcin C transport system substrate-binding protein